MTPCAHDKAPHQHQKLKPLTISQWFPEGVAHGQCRPLSRVASGLPHVLQGPPHSREEPMGGRRPDRVGVRLEDFSWICVASTPFSWGKPQDPHLRAQGVGTTYNAPSATPGSVHTGVHVEPEPTKEHRGVTDSTGQEPLDPATPEARLPSPTLGRTLHSEVLTNPQLDLLALPGAAFVTLGQSFPSLSVTGL